jgi:hypothetical protein
LIFPGDTLDFKQGALSVSDQTQPELVDFLAKQFSIHIAPGYLLFGNHDDHRSCSYLERLGGPKLITDGWVDLGGGVGAYLMCGTQNKVIALKKLKDLNGGEFARKVLVLHEDINVFQDNDFLNAACEKFQLVVNGHNHVFRKVRDGAYLLPACLPWQPRRLSRCDLKIKRDLDGQVDIQRDSPWGFVVFGDDLVPTYEQIDAGVRIAICDVDATENTLDEAVKKTLDCLLAEGTARSLVVRIYVSARVSPEFRESIREEYKARFFDDVQLQEWQGSGRVTRELRDRLPSEDVALEKVRSEHGERAGQIVEQLASFFHLKKPGIAHKDRILTIIRDGLALGDTNGAIDPEKA